MRSVKRHVRIHVLFVDPRLHHGVTNSTKNAGLGIKVALKPEYRITPPPPLLPRAGDIPRSSFQFDFGLERKVLAEAEKENPDWSKFGSEHPPPPASFPQPPATHSMGVDPVVMKYAGLNREAVNIAVANYGDNPTKVQGFANGFSALREMGFPTNAVADALFMFENDTEKALSHLLHVMKYAGLNREAVNIAVANYGDNPTKVQGFANGFSALREMGFPTNAVADALFMFENDTEKALSHLLHGSS
ncbi:hypothetical protein DY000_02001426 [Brassica cretica]|uniref:UBA domain-containing protein n=1 Tax=Brassica cretica TaxID=69181 RepID=A0ABQ7CJQ6_BRACR|nr:hypothetical protein DY000_02001426 [Brassica cretica]